MLEKKLEIKPEDKEMFEHYKEMILNPHEKGRNRLAAEGAFLCRAARLSHQGYNLNEQYNWFDKYQKCQEIQTEIRMGVLYGED